MENIKVFEASKEHGAGKIGFCIFKKRTFKNKLMNVLLLTFIFMLLCIPLFYIQNDFIFHNYISCIVISYSLFTAHAIVRTSILKITELYSTDDLNVLNTKQSRQSFNIMTIDNKHKVVKIIEEINKDKNIITGIIEQLHNDSLNEIFAQELTNLKNEYIQQYEESQANLVEFFVERQT